MGRNTEETCFKTVISSWLSRIKVSAAPNPRYEPEASGRTSRHQEGETLEVHRGEHSRDRMRYRGLLALPDIHARNEATNPGSG